MPKITLKEAMSLGFSADWVSDSDGGMVSKKGYGHVHLSVVTDDDGHPLYDRPILHETPHVLTWLFSRAENDTILSGLIKERRDTAAPADGKTTVNFWGPPRGLLDEGESTKEAAVREVGEETGAQIIKGVWDMGDVITNETCTGTFTPMVAIEVDPDVFDPISSQHGEQIFTFEFFTRSEILVMINEGTHEGTLCNSALFIAAFQKFCIKLDCGDFDSQE